MNVVCYVRKSTTDQNWERQLVNLKEIAEQKHWKIIRNFCESISGNTKAHTRREFNEMVRYIENNGVNLIMVSEVSRLGRRVTDILNTIEFLHEKGIALYIQQFNMISLEDGKENPTVKLLCQMMSIGAELENNLRKERQREGIAIAKIQNKYCGRKEGAVADKDNLFKKYRNVLDLLEKSELSIRRIATITGHSINTVRRIKKLSLS